MAERRMALVVGATRGIGLGVAREFIARGWDVIATARRPDHAIALRELSAAHPGRVTIPQLDMNDRRHWTALLRRWAVKGWTRCWSTPASRGQNTAAPSAATAVEIGALMFTNAIAPVRLARSLVGNIRPGSGVLAFTSSAMGSVAVNPGGHELYRASKAALNSLTRGLWGEIGGRKLTMVSLHPGWVRTDMGGSSRAGFGGGQRGRARVGDRTAKRRASAPVHRLHRQGTALVGCRIAGAAPAREWIEEHPGRLSLSGVFPAVGQVSKPCGSRPRPPPRDPRRHRRRLPASAGRAARPR